MNRRDLLKLTSAVIGGAATLPIAACSRTDPPAQGLWDVWDRTFAKARYVSLSHVLDADSPLWKGFPPTTQFAPGSGRFDDTSAYVPFSFDTHGFETTAYQFSTDQFGTQLDPPAHWHPCFPAIDELPPTLALRKLAVVSIADKVAADSNYHLSVDDIQDWERTHGRIPEGSVVMVRSDWSKRWPDTARFRPADGKFPGVALDALKLLHLDRRIVLHGHEPLDTDSTPTLVGEDWLLNNGYMQAEGVTNLDQVPPAGALIAIGFPRFRGGTGGFASFTAICPETWVSGAQPELERESPLPYNAQRLAWQSGVRRRTTECNKPKGKLSLN